MDDGQNKGEEIKSVDDGEPILEDEYIKKSSFNSFVFLGAIVLLLIILLVGVKLLSPPSMDDMIAEIIEKGETDNGYMYRGFVFLYMDGLWHTQWQRGEVMFNTHFHYSPIDVVDVPIIGGLDPDLDASKFYVTFDPLEDNISLIAVAASEMGLSLVKVMGVKIIPACYKNETAACSDRPIITCDNTEEGVIFIRSAKYTNVIMEDNCIIIQGKGDDLLKAVDKFLFKLYRIVEDEQEVS